MKKLLLTLGVLVAFLGASAYAETFAVTKVVEVPGATKAQVFQKVRTWSERFSKYYNADEKSGVIVTYAEIAYPSPPVDRIQYTFVFKIKNTVQNNKDTLVFQDVMLKAPRVYSPDVTSGLPFYGGEVNPAKSKKDIAAENKVLNYVATNLTDYLHAKASTTCPMERNAQCGVLFSSPEEMQKHMKTMPKK